MSKKVIFIIPIVIVSFIVGFSFSSFMPDALALQQNTQTSGQNTPPLPDSRPISDSLAYAFFENYHRSSSPNRSEAPLRNRGEAITQFYVGNDDLIEPLKSKARELGKEFIGLSAIPAYNDMDSTNTLIFVAVVDADQGGGVKPQLMLPDVGDSWTDYIYDFVVECPETCPNGSNRLWNKNWNP